VIHRVDGFDGSVVIADSHPAETTGGVSQWSVNWVSNTGAALGSKTLKVWVLCAPDILP
jgi:hypothetical protein